MAKLAVRDAVEGDAPKVAMLLGSDPDVDPIERARLPAVWHWLHFEHPHRAHKVMVGEDERGAIVGHAALLPFLYRIEGRERIGGFQCQLAVREDVRSTGLFLRLMRKALAEHRQAGFDFVYSLVTRPAVLDGYVALGFHRVGKVPVAARPVRLHPIVEKLSGRPTLVRPLAPLMHAADRGLALLTPRRAGAIQVVRASKLEAEQIAALDRAYVDQPCVAVRNEAILRWRFEASPRPEYRLFLALADGRMAGMMVLRSMPMKGLPTLAVVDLAADGDLAALALLGEAERLARAEGAALLATLLLRHGRFRRVFRRMGFIETPESFTFVVHRDKGSGTPPVPLALEDWQLSFFEHDFV